MEAVYDRIAPFVKGQASYYNYIDPNLPIETPYFQNGVELNPGVLDTDKEYWIDRLREVKSRYNPKGMLSNPLGFDIATSKESVPVGVPVSAPTAIDQSSGASVSSSYLATSAFVVFLSGYLLLQSTHASSVFLQHDMRWRRKSE